MSRQRTQSGNLRLDEILDGGVPANSMLLIMGLPGAGKTVMAQQYLYHNATTERPGVYLSTVSEPMEKLLRYGQSLEFFDSDAIGTRVHYQSLAEVLDDQGLEGVFERVEAILKEYKPSSIVIDSFKALHDYTVSDTEFRGFMHRLAALLSAFPVLTVLVGEYSPEAVAGLPEFAVADAIFSLELEASDHREKRVLQVIKLRGSDFKSGRHAYRITSSGLQIFPRLADQIDIHTYQLPPDRIEIDIPGLELMVPDGLWRGSSTVVSGNSGSGKTLFGLHFIFSGADGGETGMIATFQENPVQLARICSGFGWNLESDMVHVAYRSPVDLHIDEWVYDLLTQAQDAGVKRLLIDSLGDIKIAADEEVRFREYMYSLLQRLSRAGITVVMTQERDSFFATDKGTAGEISHLSDNIVLLDFEIEEDHLNRTMTVLKTRGSDHDHTVRLFRITEHGMVIDDGKTRGGDGS